jgi:hypothetical protein
MPYTELPDRELPNPIRTRPSLPQMHLLLLALMHSLPMLLMPPLHLSSVLMMLRFVMMTPP